MPTICSEADLLKLTARQRDVLSLIAQGLSNKDYRPNIAHRGGDDED